MRACTRMNVAIRMYISDNSLSVSLRVSGRARPAGARRTVHGSPAAAARDARVPLTTLCSKSLHTTDDTPDTSRPTEEQYSSILVRAS